MSNDYLAYDDNGKPVEDVDLSEIIADREEELDGAMIIIAFLFTPIIILAALAIWMCCRGYRDPIGPPPEEANFGQSRMNLTYFAPPQPQQQLLAIMGRNPSPESLV